MIYFILYLKSNFTDKEMFWNNSNGDFQFKRIEVKIL